LKRADLLNAQQKNVAEKIALKRSDASMLISIKSAIRVKASAPILKPARNHVRQKRVVAALTAANAAACAGKTKHIRGRPIAQTGLNAAFAVSLSTKTAT
jgi:hypothetical protein